MRRALRDRILRLVKFALRSRQCGRKRGLIDWVRVGWVVGEVLVKIGQIALWIAGIALTVALFHSVLWW